MQPYLRDGALATVIGSNSDVSRRSLRRRIRPLLISMMRVVHASADRQCSWLKLSVVRAGREDRPSSSPQLRRCRARRGHEASGKPSALNLGQIGQPIFPTLPLVGRPRAPHGSRRAATTMMERRFVRPEGRAAYSDAVLVRAVGSNSDSTRRS